jgi:hypothetical protein
MFASLEHDSALDICNIAQSRSCCAILILRTMSRLEAIENQVKQLDAQELESFRSRKGRRTGLARSRGRQVHGIVIDSAAPDFSFDHTRLSYSLCGPIQNQTTSEPSVLASAR